MNLLYLVNLLPPFPKLTLSAVAKAGEKPTLEGEAETPKLPQQAAISSPADEEDDPSYEFEEYDVTVIEEPMALGRDKRKRCVEAERTVSLALEVFPCNLQEQLDQYVDKSYMFC